MISEVQVRPGEETIHRTYYAVFVEDVDREYEELRKKGVHFVKPPTTQPWGQRIAYFEDPEGNILGNLPLREKVGTFQRLKTYFSELRVDRNVDFTVRRD